MAAMRKIRRPCWYIGYDLTEAVPDHSSLSKIRERYGLTTFQQFFERIIELCVQAGLVWGAETSGVGRTALRGSQAISWLETVSVTWIVESEHRRRVDGSGAEPETTSQVSEDPKLPQPAGESAISCLTHHFLFVYIDSRGQSIPLRSRLFQQAVKFAVFPDRCKLRVVR